MSVKELMNAWGREFLRAGGHEVADDAEIRFQDEYSQSYEGCETCGWGSDEAYTVDVSTVHPHPYVWREYSGSMTDLLREMSEGGY